MSKHFRINKAITENQKLFIDINIWKQRADGFYRASEYLFSEMIQDHHWITKVHKPMSSFPYNPDLDFTYILLIGYCLENMIKANLISISPALVTATTVSSKLKTHNLEKLYADLNINFDEEQKDLLNFLTPHITWYSKYPLPLSSKDLIESSGYNPNKLRVAFISVYERLTDKLQQDPALSKMFHNYNFRPHEMR